MAEGLGEVFINQWIGGFIFWMLKGFSGKYKDQLVEKYLTRNVWTSYTLQLVIVGAIIYCTILEHKQF
jgi:hypothetical protein